MIRSALKSGIKRILGMENQTSAAAPPPPPAWRESPTAPAPVAVAPVAPPAPVIEVASVVQPPPAVEAAPVVEATAVVEAAPVVEVAPEVAAAPVVEAAPKKKKSSKKKNVEAEVEAPAPVAPPAEDSVGAPAYSLEMVQELFDEMVRPALQGDGGDIKLVKIERNDIYVRLVGSCQSCPSSTATMKMGVEALLREELPNFGSLIQVD